MENKHDQQVTLEVLKSNGVTRTFSWMDWRNKKDGELADFKKMLTPDWDSNSEKVYKKREEEHKKMMLLQEEFIKFMFPEEKDHWKLEYELTVLITKTK